MGLSQNWYFILILFIGLLGLVVAIILFFANRDQSFSARVLALYLFCASVICINFNLSNTDFFLHYPHLWRTVVWAAFSVPPLAYLYVRTVLEQQFRFRRTDAYFFLPAVLYTFSLLPFYIRTTAEKLEVVSRFMNDKALISTEPEGTLPLGWGFTARMVYGLCMAIAQYIMLYNWRKKILSGSLQVRQNVEIFRWLIYFTLVMSISYVILTVETIIHISRYIDLNKLIILTISSNILFVSLYLLLRPNILYGLIGWFQEPVSEPLTIFSENSDVSGEKEGGNKRTSLSPEQKTMYILAIENHLIEHQPFKKRGYKISDMALELDIPIYQLSAFINQEYAKNFNEFINDLRVDNLIHRFQTSSDFNKYTLDSLAKEAGFNSRHTFINAVKRKTGKNPSVFFGMPEH